MASFNFIVISIAAVILILILTYISIRVSTAKKDEIFPPTYNNCPDGWEVGENNMCKAPLNGNIGSPPINSNTKFVTLDTNSRMGISSSDSSWIGGSGLSSICAKKKWANMNNISWDGVSNYNSC